MILRKPYAFLIKHFRLIHLILAILACFSIYRTKIVLDFFNDYIISMVNVIGQDLQATLIPWSYSFVPILIIILNLVLLFVLSMKKKPYLFYVINIVIYIFVIIVLNVSSSTLQTMSTSLIDARTVRLVRDFLILSFASQFISVPIIIVRCVGFDIRKFNFKEDLKELEISEEDREEFEVQLTFDKNKFVRNIRKMFRFFKYSYKENMLVYNFSFLFALIAVGTVIYSNIFVKAPTIGFNTSFSGNGFTLNVLNSYLVNTDYEGNIIDDDYYFLLVKTRIKNNYTSPSALDVATTKIVIGNYYYLPIMSYKDKFFDFGSIYQNEKIGNEYVEKTLLYQIPKQLVDNEMILSYVNKNSFTDKEGFKSTNVKINSIDLTGINSSERSMLGQTMYLDESILSDYKITINSYEINEKYKLKYNYCISGECIESFDYLTPALNTNYDKTLLKITGGLEKQTSIDGVYDLYDFIEKFGKIRYNVNGVSKTQNVKLKEVVSTKVSQKDIYYIEVPKEVENSTNISFVFTIRDRIYEYVLK